MSDEKGRSDDEERGGHAASPTAVAAATGGVGTDNNTLTWTEEEEKKLLKKIDWNMIPFMSLLYLMSFLDRVNIGQARLSGLEDDLGLKGTQYLTALTIFFVGYVIFEVPSNILIKKFRPSRWISFLMISWSIVMTLMGTVSSYKGLVVARFFLGLTECGLFPGICYALTMWYKRRESSKRISFFFSAATVAGAFGGLLAFGIGHMDGIAGKGGWAWIFIIEGLITFVIACLCPWLVHDFPEDARFLNERERAIVIKRLQMDQGAAGEAPFNWAHIRKAFLDWHVYFYMLIYIGIGVPLYALALFTPTIISVLGTWSTAESQLLSTPPYFLGFATTMLTAWWSDRNGKRGVFITFWMSWAIIGYILLISVNPLEHPAVSYVGIFFAVSGISPCIGLCIAWCGNNLGPTYKRATGMGMMFTLGNSGGIVSSESYRPNDSPRFITGHAICLGFSAMAIFCSVILMIDYTRENKRRDREHPRLAPDDQASDADEKVGAQFLEDADMRNLKGWEVEGLSQQEVLDLGDKHPGFRYLL